MLPRNSRTFLTFTFREAWVYFYIKLSNLYLEYFLKKHSWQTFNHETKSFPALKNKNIRDELSQNMALYVDNFN